jgi:hypothetical protein
MRRVSAEMRTDVSRRAKNKSKNSGADNQNTTFFFQSPENKK